MTRAWPLLVLVVLLGWPPNEAFAQMKLKVTEKSSVKLDPKNEWFSGPYRGIGEVAALSPDGKTLALLRLQGGAACELALCDPTTGGVAIKGHYGEVPAALTFNADGTMLAVGTGRPEVSRETRLVDGTVTLWDMKTRKQSAILRLHEASPDHLAFSPDGKALATRAKFGLGIWEVATGKERAVLEAGGVYKANSMVYSPDGKLLWDGRWFWNTETEERWVPPNPLIKEIVYAHQIAFSPTDAKVIATIHSPYYQQKSLTPGRIKLWDMKTGTEQRVIEPRWGVAEWDRGKPPRMATSPTFSPDGKLLAVEEVGGIGLYAVETGKPLGQIENGRFPFVFSKDGETLTGLDQDDRTIKVWKLTWEKEPGK